MLVGDLSRSDGTQRLRLSLSDTPVFSDLDPDAFAILVRNLVENALRHGCDDQPVEVALSPGGLLRVDNAGPLLAADELAHLTDRFTRKGERAGGGLGLAIVAAIAERTGAVLRLLSPRPGCVDGFSATVQFPPA
jgi:two-component system OmpR family sensor kinase